MKHRIFGIAAGLTSLIILIGCVARVGQVAFEPPAGSHIETIGIPTISPASLIFNDPKNPALKFGLIGGLIHAGEMKGKATELYDNPRSYYAELMHRVLFDDLVKVGYVSADIPVERRNPKAFIDNYDGLPGPAVDAVLDVVLVEGGYTNVTYPKDGGARFGGFRPYFRVIAKLVTPGSGKILYSGTFMYGHHNRYITATNLDAPPENFFDNVDAMKVDQGKVKKGLELAINAIAGKIAEQLASGNED
jgi:hypothetical protein